MAIVSLVALLAALALAALISFKPWAASSIAPQLSVAPGLGIALDDSVEVAPSRQLAVGGARPAPGGGSRLVADAPSGGTGGNHPELGIAPARAVMSPASRRPPRSSPSPPSPEPPPAPVAVPVAAPAPSPAPAALPPTQVGAGYGGVDPGPSAAGMGPVDDCSAEAIQVHEGDEHALSFSFYIQPTVYRAPEADNLIVQFRSESSERPSFGLQLWDDGSGTQRGLWSSGEAMDGERFLSPVTEGGWHEVALYFQASSAGEGFYLAFLDGRLIDLRAGASLIASGSACAEIDVGLFRDGQPVAGSPEIFFGPTELEDTLEAVAP